MSLKIVYGVSGSGKTRHCFESIQKIVETSSDRIIYMVPEQYSLETERKISAAFSAKAMDRVEVLGFERLAHRVFSSVGPAVCDFLDDNAKTMLIEKVLLKLKGKLTYFVKNAEVTGFAGLVLDIIKTLKGACVTPQQLSEVGETCESTHLKYKLYDLSLILSEYNKFFELPYADSDDNLLNLAQKIEKFGLFKNTHIFMDNYVSFSKQQLGVIGALLKNCLSVTVTLTCDSLKYTSDFQLFYRSQLTAETLFGMAHDNGTTVLPNLYLNKPSDDSELEFLKNNYFSTVKNKYVGKTQNITICKGKNYNAEVEQAAAEIKRLVREEGCRYRDIAVVTREASVYYGIIKSEFERHGILFNITEPSAASDNFLHKAMLSVFDIVASDYSFESVFGFIRSMFCDISDTDKFLMENYVIEAGNTSNLWRVGYEPKFQGEFTDKNFERVKKALAYVQGCINSFAEKFSGRKTVADIVGAYREFLEYVGAEKKTAEFIKKQKLDGNMQLAAETAAVYNHIISSINQMNLYFGDEKITFEKFYKILKTGIDNTQLDEIPSGTDDVLVTSADRFLANGAKVVFVLGASEGSIPRGYIDEGVLKDSELALLGIEENVLRKHCDENYLIYRLFSSAKEKLYISYPFSNNEGEGIAPSQIVAGIREIFPEVRQMQNVFKSINYLDGIESVIPTFNKVIENGGSGFWSQPMHWFEKNKPELYDVLRNAQEYKNTPPRLLTENVEKLYRTDDMKSSISKIEAYNRCAFAYFVRYGLNVKERRERVIGAADYGSYMHRIIELYSIFASEYGWENIDEELCSAKTAEITRQVLNENLSEYYTGSQRYSYLFKKIISIMDTVLQNITRYYRESEYVSFGCEIEFGKDGDFPPIEVTLSDGTKVQLTGKVDRADIRKTADGNYVSIVDYKSGSKDIAFEQILCGVQIQLPVYLKAVCDGLSKSGENTVPAAMLYYHINSPIISGDKNMSDEQIQKEITKELRMRGIMLEESGFSGVFTFKKNTTSSGIDKLCKTAYKKVKNTLEKIIGGGIDINPVRVGGTASCDYCPYSNVCNFDPGEDENGFTGYRKIDMEEFLEYAEMD